MRSIHPRRRARAVMVAAACAATALAAPAADAATWTEVPTGITATITNAEHRGDAIWFTATNGRIYRRAADGTVTTRYTPITVRPLTDIEFQPGGAVGIAVGNGGTVVRTNDGGENWATVGGIVASNEGDGSGNKCTVNTPLDTDLNFVHWAGPNRVFVGGSLRQLVAANSATLSQVGAAGTWSDANRRNPAVAGNNCRFNYTGPFIDMAVASPSSVYVAGEYGYAQYLANYDATSTQAQEKAFVANANRPGGRVAIDPDDPQRMWSVNGGAAYGVSGAVYTENGWGSNDYFRFAADYPDGESPWDVDYAAGTVVAVGSQGKILNSVNGRDFFNGPATGAIASAEWHAVSLKDASTAVVAGVAGKMAISSDANVVPAPVVVTPTPTPTVTPKPTSTPTPALPKPTLASSTAPPLTGKAARIVGKYVVFKVKGKLGLPLGLARKAACKGTMSVSVYKGKKRLKSKSVKVNSKCGYRTTVRVKRSKVGKKTKKLKLKVAFRGNAVLGKLSSTYNVKVKK